jgi:predicted nucleotidyltransferase
MSGVTETDRPTDVMGYVTGWRERAAESRRRALAWRRSALARLDAAVRLLVEDFGVTRVVLFGSLSRDEAEPGSDLDLLVAGLPPARLIEATVALQRVVDHIDVDLVPVELARPEVAARAMREGVVLYGD